MTAPMTALACLLLAAPAADPPADDTPADDTPEAKAAAFREMLTDTVLTGRFSIDGKPETKAESYEIGAVTDQGGGVWAVAARIAYGENDVTVPVILEVKWAGDTPVMVLDELAIPGLGTFSARVLVHKTGDGPPRYAGTWQHDGVGGTLGGVIAKKTPAGEK